MKYGYYLVRNPEFDNASLIQELRKAGAESFKYDLEDGSKQYPGKERLLKLLKAGDTIIIYELSHLFERIKHLEKLTKNFQQNSISLISVSEKLDTSLREYFYEDVQLIASFNRSAFSIQTKIGLDVAREFGKKGGRKPGQSKYTEQIHRLAVKLYLLEYSPEDILELTGIKGRTSLYRILNKEGIDPKRKSSESSQAKISYNKTTEDIKITQENRIFSKRKRERPKGAVNKAKSIPQNAVRLYNLGASIQDILDECEIPNRLILNSYLKNEGVTMRPRGRPRKNK